MSAEHKSERLASAASIAHAASIWHARREAGLDQAGRRELRIWLAADPAHAEALSRHESTPSALDWPLYSGNLDGVLAGLEFRAARRRIRRRFALGTVAAVMLLGALFSARWLQPDAAPLENSVAIEAPRSLRLPDGSIAELKDDAEIQVSYGQGVRKIALVRGAVHFTVTKDPERPFLVTAGAVTARAVGTAFLVDLDREQLALVVTEGRVALDHETATPSGATTLAFLNAGESAHVASLEAVIPPRITSLSIEEAKRRLTWRTPRLTFNGTPLREVVAMLNRHNQEQLMLADPNLGSLRLSGSLRADRVDALLEMLQSDLDIAAEHVGARIVLRKASP